MKNYKVTITDDFFGMELTGEFKAKSEQVAKDMAIDYYASELGTFEDCIEILKVEVI